MPHVTDIKPIKHPGRYSIYLDWRFAFVLSELELAGSGLKVGSELSDHEAKSWQDKAALGKLQNLALHYLAIRPRSTHEVRDYLRRKGYEDSDIDLVQEYLESYGYLDDAAFARSWVEYRQNTSQRSIWRLGNELRVKGIAPDIINEVLQTQDESEQLAVVAALIKKKRARYTDEQKLIEYCLHQGFSLALIRQALREQAEAAG